MRVIIPLPVQQTRTTMVQMSPNQSAVEGTAPPPKPNQANYQLQQYCTTGCWPCACLAHATHVVLGVATYPCGCALGLGVGTALAVDSVDDVTTLGAAASATLAAPVQKHTKQLHMGKVTDDDTSLTNRKQWQHTSPSCARRHHQPADSYLMLSLTDQPHHQNST